MKLSVARPLAFVLVAGAAASCAWLKADVAPILTVAAADLVRCIEQPATDSRIIADVLSGNDADLLLVAVQCGGSSADIPALKAIGAAHASRVAPAPSASASAK